MIEEFDRKPLASSRTGKRDIERGMKL